MPGDSVYGKTSSDIENVDWSVGTAQLPNVVRFGSSSSQASQSSGDICRICHCESDPQNPLLTPCYCSGSLKYVHQTCLQQWLTASETNACELCKFPFIMHTKIKPFNEWRSLDMSGVERRRLFCAVLFHFATALCVIWSLCVLIERAAEEVKRGLIGWPFWTKLVVVTVGLTGGVVFMYIQCRQYLHLCHRWRARNRILLIQNAPEKMHPLSPPSPVLISRHHLPRNGSSSTSNGAANSNINRPSTGQIIANIENNPMHYDRDWTLDDSSQSSFKPCLQGSGSMTPMPFHDSVHNMYENPVRSSASSTSHGGGGGGVGSGSGSGGGNGSGGAIISGSGGATASIGCGDSSNGSNHDLSQMPSTSTTINHINNSNMNSTQDRHFYQFNNAQSINYGNNSAVFLENSDILNDADYPKLYHRHSTIFMAPEFNDNLDKFLGTDVRRYSDTKLLKQQQHNTLHHMDTNSGNDDNDNNVENIKSMPIFNVSNISTSQPSPALSVNCHFDTNINITDILFENSGPNFDPLELNIQEMLELDVRQNVVPHIINVKPKARHSLNNVCTVAINVQGERIVGSRGNCDSKAFATENRKIFKSLPNLSASSENLLQH